MALVPVSASPPSAPAGDAPVQVNAAAPGKPGASVNNGQQIHITNNTGGKVKSLSIVPKGGGAAHSLIENLEGFKSASAALPKGGCVYNIRGQFTDGSALSIDNVDLCNDPSINITVW